MANQPISTLPRTTEIHGVDTELFPFDQTGQTVAITGTNLLAQLLSLINGHGGIDSISEPVVSGREKTYTITFDDGTTTTFTVTDGNGIASYAVAYAIGDDPTDPTATYGGYSNTLPEATDEYPFTWTRLTLTDDDGVNTVVYSVGYKGKDGETVTGSEISYGISDSATVPPSSFSPTPVSATTSNPYQWTMIETSYSDSALDTTAYCVAATPFVSVDAVTTTTLPAGSSATATVSNVISGAENEMSFAFGIPQGEKGDTGDYIDPVMSYGTSSSAVTEPTTWYNSPTSLDYSAGKFIWAKTDYTLSGAHTVQRTIKSIIGYIGANGSGSGTVTQVTFNGVAYLDDGTGNVSINVDPDDVGAIADPSVKNNGQVLTYDSTADAWVAANPATGNVNTVNNIGVTAGTTNIDLSASNIPTSDSSNVQAHISDIETDVDGKVDKTGDTMTGSLDIAMNDDVGMRLIIPSYGKSQLPSSNVYKYLLFKDKDDLSIGSNYARLGADGSTSIYLRARNSVNGSNVDNRLELGVAADGTREVHVDASSAWRDAINAVNKSGDTITGGLTLSNNSMTITNTQYASSDTPSSNSLRALTFRDKNNNIIAQLTSIIASSGRSGAYFNGHKIVNGTDVENSLGLYVDSNGDKLVALSPVPWRSALGLGSSGALPITIAQGGTGATTAEGAADDLGCIKKYNIYGGSAVTTSVKRKISFSAAVSGILYVVGNSSARCGMYVLYGSTSTVVVEPIKAASACTIATGTGYFTITSSSGSIYPSIQLSWANTLSKISETSA